MLECPLSSTSLLTSCARNLVFLLTYSNGVFFTVVLVGVSQITNDTENICVYGHLCTFLMDNVSLNISQIYSICSCAFFKYCSVKDFMSISGTSPLSNTYFIMI